MEDKASALSESNKEGARGVHGLGWKHFTDQPEIAGCLLLQVKDSNIQPNTCSSWVRLGCQVAKILINQACNRDDWMNENGGAKKEILRVRDVDLPCWGDNEDTKCNTQRREIWRDKSRYPHQQWKIWSENVEKF